MFPDATPEGATLFVKGLPGHASEEELKKIFKKAKAVRLMRRPDNSCKGFGFVDFDSADKAQKALSKGAKYGSTDLFLEISKPGSKCEFFILLGRACSHPVVLSCSDSHGKCWSQGFCYESDVGSLYELRFLLCLS